MLYGCKTCFIFLAAAKQSPPGETVLRKGHNLNGLINSFPQETHKPSREHFLLCVSEHIGNSGSTMSGDILQHSPERPSLARTKGISLHVTRPVKSEA